MFTLNNFRTSGFSMTFCSSAADSRPPYPTPCGVPSLPASLSRVLGFQSGGLGCEEGALGFFCKVYEKKRHHQTLSVMVSWWGIASRVMPKLSLELGGEGLDLVAEMPSHPGLRRAPQSRALLSQVGSIITSRLFSS